MVSLVFCFTKLSYFHPGAENAEAESIQRQRYRQAKDRMLLELQDQIITRIEGLDEAHSSLEYARQRLVT